MTTKKTVKILSFDGGGTRGYLQCKFLQRFCQQAGITDLSKEFDVFAGSSVGAINAVAFASGMTPEMMMQFFREKTPWIFTIRGAGDLLSNNASSPSNKPNLIQKAGMFFTKDPWYKATSTESNYGNALLKSEIFNIFGDRTLETLVPHILITANNYSHKKPISFINNDYIADKNHISNVKIVDALIASSSAPFYLPKYAMHLSPDPEAPDDLLEDGGLFANNPTGLAYDMAKRLYPGAKRYCILSLSTGTGTISEKGNEEYSQEVNNFLHVLRILNTMISNSEIVVHQRFVTLSECQDDNVFYYRFKSKLDPNKDTELDTSTPEFFDYLDEAVITKYNNSINEISLFIDRLFDDNGQQ